MGVNENELLVLKQLSKMDRGEMKGAYWPIGLILKEAGVDIVDAKMFADTLKSKGLISIKGQCVLISEKGRGEVSDD